MKVTCTKCGHEGETSISIEELAGEPGDARPE